MAGDGNGDGDNEAECPRLGESSRRKRQMRRSSWASWLGMGMLAAVAKANGSDSGPRASCERAKERRGMGTGK